MTDLATLQQWLTAIIIRPGILQDKIAAADDHYQIDNTRIIKASQLSPTERIHVYARGYVLRLMECMRADYPALRALLGTELFDNFAQAYLVNLPPHSPSLFDLGKRFPEFIRSSQPPQISAEKDNMFDLPVELAIAEREKSEVLRSKGLEHLEDNLSSENSVLGFFENNYTVSPCLRLLSLRYSLISFIKASEKGEYAPTPEKRHNFLAVCRKNYALSMYELEAWQWYFLHALHENDYPTSVKLAATKSGMNKDALSADLMLWLPIALNTGYIYQY